MDVGKKQRSVALRVRPDWRWNPQPRYVPCPGIAPAALVCGRRSRRAAGQGASQVFAVCSLVPTEHRGVKPQGNGTRGVSLRPRPRRNPVGTKLTFFGWVGVFFFCCFGSHFFLVWFFHGPSTFSKNLVSLPFWGLWQVRG